MSIKMIWASSNNGVIGKDGKLPWYLPEDLTYFREMTENQTVVMGRNTYESLTEPLRNRRNIVLSKTMESTPKVEVYTSIGDLMLNCLDFWVIGGRQVYDAFMPWADELRLTKVRQDFEGDTYEPTVILSRFNMLFSSPLKSVTGLEYQFFKLERIKE